MSVNTWQPVNTWQDSSLLLSVTESLSPFSDSSNLNIAEIGDVDLVVTETLSVFVDDINVEIPVTITINPSNIIRVKRR